MTALHTAVKLTERYQRRRPSLGIWRLAAIMVIALAIYLTISITEYTQYLSNGYDLGIFDQVVRQYAHFHLPVSSVKAPGYDVLGDHFSPVMALFAPLYWIWDDPIMLLVGQALLIAASIPIVHRIAGRRLPENPAFMMTAIYALGWPIGAMVNFDVHELAFAVPLLSASLNAVDQGRYRRAVWWTTSLLFVKEDMGFLVVAIGALMWALGPPGRSEGSPVTRLKRPSPEALALIAIGIGGYLITTKVIVPHFAPDGGYSYWQFDAIGKDLPASLINLFTRPWHAADVFFMPFAKSLSFFMLLAPLAFLPLRSPYLVLAAPLLAEKFFNERKQLWVPLLHYSALPWLVLVVACIDAAARMRLFEPVGRTRRRRVVAAWMVALQVLTVWAWAVIEEGVASGRGPVGRFVEWNSPGVLAREAAVHFVPQATCVEADNGVVAHLTRRNWVTLPGAPGIDPDFVILDTSHKFVGPSQVGAPGMAGPKSVLVLRRALGAGFEPVYANGSWIVLRAPTYAGRRSACRPLGKGPGGPSPFGTFKGGALSK